jgi:hypothetical protein
LLTSTTVLVVRAVFHWFPIAHSRKG